MNIIIVDDDAAVLKKHSEIIKELAPDAVISAFDSGLSALALARKQKTNIAFLGTDMPELNGIDLGQYLKELYPTINLIYITADDSYACDALRLHASGYILKPADGKSIKRELDDLRYSEAEKKQKRVFAQTFGNFELFVDGKPITFKYTRTKEIVAVLINNRGAQTTNGEIIACLWEDDGDPEKKASYLRNLRQDLRNTLKDLNLEDIILKQRGSMAIAADAIECDLYDWLEKKKSSKYDYTGDYMNQYSWAEFYHAELDEISYALYDE